MRPKTWGDIYTLAVRRGCDHGYAAWLADRWEKRRERMKQLDLEVIEARYRVPIGIGGSGKGNLMLDKMDWWTIALVASTLLAYWACSAWFGGAL